MLCTHFLGKLAALLWAHVQLCCCHAVMRGHVTCHALLSSPPREDITASVILLQPRDSLLIHNLCPRTSVFSAEFKLLVPFYLAVQ